MKQCTLCKEFKDESEFHKDRSTKSGLSPWCKTCRKSRNQTAWVNRKKELSEKRDKSKAIRTELVKSLKTPCAKCGETRLYLIQFHHRDPKVKSFDVPQVSSHGLKAIKAEAKKCICLCANCHMEFHWFYGKLPTDAEKCLEEYLST